MNALALHFWVSIRGALEPPAMPAAFAKRQDADTWASVQSMAHQDTRDVWYCTGTAPPVRLSAYCAGKALP